ncbi:uncharacterized protein LOC133175913 [Saccostrea echinata]|uniref:uncharacterized protein LOC133175913 n=1 Tax=Saccostrea echinata TaxID=191078 RepID=UPI002A840852|nr:uncharacterized protein LOC133175913 [Saccostrea echinata]
MHTALVVIVCVYELLLRESDGYIVDHKHRCDCNQVSHGFRRDLWQKEAIHFCFPRGRENKKCKVLSADGVGIDCRKFGEHYHLQGGFPNRLAQCCEKEGQRLVRCEIPNAVFSYHEGVNIMYFDKVLRSLKSANPSNPLDGKFIIELCEMEFDELPPPTPSPVGNNSSPVTTRKSPGGIPVSMPTDPPSPQPVV